jgi:hypothetical protein
VLLGLRASQPDHLQNMHLCVSCLISVLHWASLVLWRRSWLRLLRRTVYVCVRGRLDMRPRPCALHCNCLSVLSAGAAPC